MIRIFGPEKWGSANFSWLNAKHLYSFGQYYNPSRMGFGPLRVVNHDIIAAGKGFDPHPHSNMEIITIILEGELHHADTLGGHGVIRVGDVQRMSAGTGITHSEINASDKSTRLFQIWVEPDSYHLTPSYEQRSFDQEASSTVIVSPDQQDNSLIIHQNLTIRHIRLNKDELWTSKKDLSTCLLIGNGAVNFRDTLLPKGTAIEIDKDESSITVTATERTDLYEISWPQ